MYERRETRAGLRAARRRAWWAALASVVLVAPVAFGIMGKFPTPDALLVLGPKIGRLLVLVGLIAAVTLPHLGVVWRLARHPDPVGGGLAIGTGWLSIVLVVALVLAPIGPYHIPWAVWYVGVLLSATSVFVVFVIAYVVAVIAAQRVLIREGARLLRAAVEAREARRAEGAVMAPFACALLWGALWLGAEIAEDHRERQRTLRYERMRAAERAATHPVPPPLERRWEVELVPGALGLPKAPTAPVVGPDGTVYVALDAALVAVAPSGEVKWRNATIQSLSVPAAVARDGTIYVGGRGGSLFAARPDGTLKWAVSIAAPSATSRELRRPAVGDDGTIYVGGMIDRYDKTNTPLTAVSTDGTVRWQTEVGGGSNDAIITTPDGGVYVVGNGDGIEGRSEMLFRLDAKGAIRARQALPSGTSVPGGPVAGRDGTIYIARVRGVVAVRPPDSTFRRIELGDRYLNGLLVGDDGTLFMASGKMILARGSDGRETWTHDVARLGDDEAAGGLTLADGGRRLIVSTSYRVVVLDAEDGRELADYAPTIDRGNRPPSPRLHWPSRPAVAADGTIYIVDGYYRLYALQMR